MYRHREDEIVILPVSKIKLLHPQFLHHMRVHEPVTTRSTRYRLERGPIIQGPIRGDLNHFTLPQFAHGTHPVPSSFGVISLDPDLRIIGREVRLHIMVHETVIIQNPSRFELGNELSTRTPRRRRVAKGFTSSEFGQDFDAFVQDILLLFGGELRDVFVGVTMQTQFVLRIPDFGELGGERFEGVGWAEPGGTNIVLFVQGEQAVDADGCAVDATGHIGGVLRSAVGCVDPSEVR